MYSNQFYQFIMQLSSRNHIIMQFNLHPAGVTCSALLFILPSNKIHIPFISDQILVLAKTA